MLMLKQNNTLLKILMLLWLMIHINFIMKHNVCGN